MPVFGLPVIGTDPAASLGFAARRVASGPLEGRKSAFVEGVPMCEYVHGNTVLAHLTVGVIMHDLGHSYKPVLSSIGAQLAQGVRGKMHALGSEVRALFDGSSQTDAKKEETDQQLLERMKAAGATQEEIVAALEARSKDASVLYNLLVEDGFAHHGKDAPCLETVETAQYRARPLDGVWATGPFLHNGSVPTLADLLTAPADRPKRFEVGDSDLDPRLVGFLLIDADGDFVMDTSLPGNLNSGHSYGVTLPEAEKMDLIEYLKTL